MSDQPSLLERLLRGTPKSGAWTLPEPAVKALYNLEGSPGQISIVPSSGTYGGQIDYQGEAGPASSNSLVMACVGWIVATFPEAPLQVMRRQGETLTAVPEHPLVQLIEMPNPYYSGQDLWDAMLTDYNINGNGFWLAALNASGKAAELWYEPSFSIRPISTEQEFIKGWQIYRKSDWQDLDPRKVRVIHFRDGIDPHDPRLGLSDLAAAYREMYTDNEAARYTANLLRNRGIPGVVISPKSDDAIIDAVQIKNDYLAKFTGDKRGEPLVMSGAMNVTKLDFSPSEMDLGSLRTIPEERISALLGVPAIVAGLGAGLDSATYSNFKQAERKGWTGNIIPAHRRFAAALQVQLLPLLGDPASERVTFDHSQVAALMEDQDNVYSRMAVGYNAGFIKRNEARQATGWPADDPADDTYKTQNAPALAPPLDMAPLKALVASNGHGREG
jgi:HK97 family phage portal protein